MYTTHHPLAIHQSAAGDHAAEKITGLMIACWAGVLLALAGCATEESSSVEDYREQYNKPLLSPGTQFAALPPRFRTRFVPRLVGRISRRSKERRALAALFTEFIFRIPIGLNH